jgi:hypothetical protein
MKYGETIMQWVQSILESPVRNAHRYLSNRTDCLDYPAALKLGLPIGSGIIESGHRHVLHARLKKAGAAWLHEHADNLAHLRVLRAKQKWERYGIKPHPLFDYTRLGRGTTCKLRSYSNHSLRNATPNKINDRKRAGANIQKTPGNG